MSHFSDYKSALTQKFPHITLTSIRPLRSYTSSGKHYTRYSHNCTFHGSFDATMHSMLRSSNLGGCPKCGYAIIGQKLRKSIVDYRRELRTKQLTVLSTEYLGATVPLLHRCDICQAEFHIKPDYVRANKQSCPVCRKGDRTEDTYKKVLESFPSVRSESYVAWNRRIKHVCTTHSETFYKTPSAIVNTNSLNCPKCALDASQKFRLSEVTVRGKTFRVQGYEGLALPHILSKFKLRITQISNTQVPVIDYSWRGRRKYYPDFFIKSLNTLVEVKSTYTMGINNMRTFNRNIAKARACEQQGYNMLFVVINNDVPVFLPKRWTSRGRIYARDYVRFKLSK